MQQTLLDQLGKRPGRQFIGYQRPQLGAAIGAGLLAGLAFVVLQTLLNVTVYGESPWTLFHMINAIPMGKEVIEPRGEFHAGAVGAAVAIHFALSAFYGVVLAHVISEAPPRIAAPLGIGFGVLVYLVNFHGFTGAFPWFAELRGAVTIATHAIFGLLLGLAGSILQRRNRPFKVAA